jgi:hypothetical protein
MSTMPRAVAPAIEYVAPKIKGVSNAEASINVGNHKHRSPPIARACLACVCMQWRCRSGQLPPLYSLEPLHCSLQSVLTLDREEQLLNEPQRA